MATKTSAKKAKEERAKATGRPPSPTEDLTDHSVPASQIAAAVDPKGTSGATVNAASIDKLNAKAEEDEEAARAEEDDSLAGRIRKSELFAVHNHNTEEQYIGISPSNDPKATVADQRLSTVQTLDAVAPRTGMVVKPKDGSAFTVGEGFGPDSTPADWARVTNPQTKKSLFG